MSQYARPISDLIATQWVYSEGSTYYGTIDETVASDADYNTSNANQVATLVCGLAPIPTAPSDHTNHILRTRVRTNSATKTCVGYVALQEGDTTIALWDYTEGTWGTAFNTKDQTLSEAQAGAITDYSNLRVNMSITNASAGGYAAISWAELSVPDAGGQIYQLEGLVTGVGEVMGGAKATKLVSGYSEALGNTMGNVKLTVPVSSLVLGETVMFGGVAVTTIELLEGLIEGTSEVLGTDIGILRKLEGLIEGIPYISGTVQATKLIEGLIGAETAVNAGIKLTVPLVGWSLGAGTVNGGMNRNMAISGVCDANSFITGILGTPVQISGMVSGGAYVGGVLSTGGVVDAADRMHLAGLYRFVPEVLLEGIINSQSGVNGVVNRLFSMQGISVGQSFINSIPLSADKLLSILVEGQSYVLGSAKGTKKLVSYSEAQSILYDSLMKKDVKFTVQVNALSFLPNILLGNDKQLAALIESLSNVPELNLKLIRKFETQVEGISTVYNINMSRDRKFTSYAEGISTLPDTLLKRDRKLSPLQVEGASNARGDIGLDKMMTALCEILSQMIGDMKRDRGLVGTTDGASTVMGNLNYLTKLVGRVAAQTWVGGTVDILGQVYMQGLCQALGVLMGEIKGNKKIDGIIVGAGVVNGILGKYVPVSGMVEDIGTVWGGIKSDKKLVGYSEGSSWAGSRLNYSAGLKGMSLGTGWVYGDLSIVAQFIVEMAGICSAISLMNGNTVLSRKFTGIIEGISLLHETQLNKLMSLEGMIEGTSQVIEGYLQRLISLVGELGAETNVQGNISRFKSLIGLIDSNAILSGAMSRELGLVGASYGVTSIEGLLNLISKLEGIIGGNSDVRGEIRFLAEELTKYARVSIKLDTPSCVVSFRKSSTNITIVR